MPVQESTGLSMGEANGAIHRIVPSTCTMPRAQRGSDVRNAKPE